LKSRAKIPQPTSDGLAFLHLPSVEQAPAKTPEATALNARRRSVVTDYGSTDDVTLAEMAGSGDRSAFGALYDRYVERVYHYVYYRVRDDDEAKDVTSEVFVKAMAAIPRYEPRRPFLAWLYRVARNLVIDRARSRRNVATVPLDAAMSDGELADGGTSEPDGELLARERRQRLRDALRFLHAEQQDVLILHFVVGLDTHEIAVILGKADSTVRGIQMRALRALRLRLTPEDLA